MNELNIYKRIKMDFQIAKKNINLFWKLIAVWGLYSIVMLIVLNGPLFTSIAIFPPLLPLLYFMGFYIFQIYKLAKKYPLFYNNWMDEEVFINGIISRMDTRVQDDPSTIKIENAAVKYIDNLIDNYSDNKMKLSDAFYNTIIETNLVDEMKYYEKFKKFKKHMNVYRNCV